MENYSGNDSKGCFMVFLLWVLPAAISLLTGIWAWDWIEPESFLGAVGFIIVWAILFRVIVQIVGIIVASIFNQ